MHEFLDEAIKSGCCILIEVSQMAHNLLINDVPEGHELPVRLTIGSTWILDEKAPSSLILTNQQNHHDRRIKIA